MSQTEPPVGGAYEGKRKEGIPIPDFADEAFFEALPELRSLTRPQLEALMGLACHCYLIMVIPNSPSGSRHTPQDAVQLVDAACKIYATKQHFPRKEAMRLVVKIMEFLRAQYWDMLCNHNAKKHDGYTIFSTMRLAVMVVPDGDSN